MSRPRLPAPSIDDLEERRLRALLAVADAVGSVDDFDAVLEAAAEATRDALGVASVAISRWERDAGRIRTLINVGDLGPGEERWPADEVYALADHPDLARLLTAGVWTLAGLDDPLADPAELALLRRLGKACSAAVPIVVREAVWGEFYVARTADMAPISLADVSFMEVVAAHVALAVRRAETLSDLQVAAYRDPLTGLANRRAFDERLAAALAREAEVVLMFADLDRLKAINDDQGHEAGDRALRSAASVLAEVAGDAAVAARIGGDEFGLVLEGRTRADAEALIAAVDARLAAAACPVTMSWGVATTSEQLRAVPALMRAADAAQYEAKERARRRVGAVGDVLAELRPGPPSDAFGQRFDAALAAALRRL